MVPPAHKMCILIIITHLCENAKKCQHCAQSVPHQPKPFTMSLEDIENALISLQDFPGCIGIFGGNPLLHPEFEKVCELLRKYIPHKARRQLFCSNAGWEKHQAVINETFFRELVAYNDHSDEQPCWHQPVMVSPRDVLDGTVNGPIEDAKARAVLQENCFVNRRWSSAITPKGAFFCEIVAAGAHLFDDIEGLPVTPGWWKKPQEEFSYQMRKCADCSMCLPMEVIPDAWGGKEWVTERTHGRLINANSRAKDKLKIIDLEPMRKFLRGHTFTPDPRYPDRGAFLDFPDWRPWIYRPFEFKAHAPKSVEVADAARTAEENLNRPSH